MSNTKWIPFISNKLKTIQIMHEYIPWLFFHHASHWVFKASNELIHTQIGLLRPVRTLGKLSLSSIESVFLLWPCWMQSLSTCQLKGLDHAWWCGRVECSRRNSCSYWINFSPETQTYHLALRQKKKSLKKPSKTFPRKGLSCFMVQGRGLKIKHYRFYFLKRGDVGGDNFDSQFLRTAFIIIRQCYHGGVY